MIFVSFSLVIDFEVTNLSAVRANHLLINTYNVRKERKRLNLKGRKEPVLSLVLKKVLNHSVILRKNSVGP